MVHAHKGQENMGIRVQLGPGCNYLVLVILTMISAGDEIHAYRFILLVIISLFQILSIQFL